MFPEILDEKLKGNFINNSLIRLAKPEHISQVQRHKKKTERERQTLYTYQHKTRKVYNNTYNVYLPKINSKNLIKALDLTTSLWENWRMKEYVKSQHEMLTTEFKK